MKTILTIATAVLAGIMMTSPAMPPGELSLSQAKTPAPQNPQIDYRSFLKIAQATESIREQRRLTGQQFKSMAAGPGTILLDARSADKYALLHLQGAVSLPFTDFTAESLAKVIPTKTTRVLIYCNNNFTGDPRAFASKSPAASLNISTLVSLATYGYHNVYELGPLLDTKTTSLSLEGSAVK